MKIASVILGLCLCSATVLAESPSVTTTTIKDGLYLLQGRGGNVMASVGDDGVLLIDSDYANYTAAYQQALTALGDGKARFLINTHWHGDHTGGNSYWAERGGVILAHDNVRERMSSPQDNKYIGRVVEPSPVEAWPMVTYEDSLALHVNGDTLEVQHYPAGHTDGDSVVFFVKANVVHLGDHFFKDRFPFVDLGSGGTIDGFIANVAVLLEKTGPETIIIPGHGSLADRGDLQRYYDMLVATRAAVKSMQAEGLDLAAIQARGLDSKWASWGGGFIKQDNWISFIVLSP
jgi:glyoxylase-like metal-dependent hydrolase (beta-lactamase superfamily II)